jgi:hypothetical protein
MISYTWKILNLYTKGELITGIKYLCTGFNGKINIDSEGTMFFTDPEMGIPLEEVTELNCIDWLEKETNEFGQSHIKNGIERQFKALEHKEAVLPWMEANTFRIKI